MTCNMLGSLELAGNEHLGESRLCYRETNFPNTTSSHEAAGFSCCETLPQGLYSCRKGHDDNSDTNILYGYNRHPILQPSDYEYCVPKESQKMLIHLLPFLSLLTHFTLTLSTNPNMIIPRATIHAANSPICYDGRDLRLEVLPSTVRDDCKRMWRLHLKDRDVRQKEPFYQPDHKYYPLYFNGVPGGCEFRIDEPQGRRILDPPRATVPPESVKWIDDQIAMAFYNVLSKCVDQHLGGILIFSTRVGDDSVKFVVHVGKQRVSFPPPRQVRNVYDRPERSSQQ